MRRILTHLKENWIRHGFETLVVVVGILVAFTMNNWNEERKTKEFEREILNDIKTSMQSNFYQLNLCINSNTNTISSCKIILNHINENLPYNDSLDVHFSRAISWCSPTFKNAGHESLKSYGNHTITNDSIRAGLDIYDAGWMETLAARQEEYFYGTASPILTDLFETVAMRTEMKPFDYDELKKSRKYRHILNTLLAYREDQNFWYERWQRRLKDLEKMIDEELERK